MKQLFVICIFLVLSTLTIAQRVAPGVPPQHYEQPAYQQQQYQQPPQPNYNQQAPPNVHPQQYQPHQQVPVQNVDQYGQVIQQQQPPIQQQHQQQPHTGHQQPQAGHVPQVPAAVHEQAHTQPGHGPGGHHHTQQVFHTGSLDMEKDHIAEHMDVPIDTSKMTDQELQFHYFKMHDADNNNKLDGCELIKSLIHWHAQGSKDATQPEQQQIPQVEEKIFTDEELNTLIDPILLSDDLNKDGFIDYPEFIRAQQKSSAANNDQR